MIRPTRGLAALAIAGLILTGCSDDGGSVNDTGSGSGSGSGSVETTTTTPTPTES